MMHGISSLRGFTEEKKMDLERIETQTTNAWKMYRKDLLAERYCNRSLMRHVFCPEEQQEQCIK